MSIVKTFLALIFSLPLLIIPQNQPRNAPQMIMADESSQVVMFSVSLTKTPVVTQTPTVDTAEWIIPVKRSTPDADGNVYHVVRQGQTLWSIAIAYETKINIILQLNNLPSDTKMVYSGQRLLMSTSPTPQAIVTVVATDKPAVENSPTLLPTPDIKKITPEPGLTPTPDFEAQALMGERLRGGLFIALVVGLVLIAGGILVNRR
jgi:LysM repeat protein